MRKLDLGSLKLKAESLISKVRDLKFKKHNFFLLLFSIIVLIFLVRATGNIQRVLFKKKTEVMKKAPAVTFEEEAAHVKAFKVKKTDFKDTLPAIGTIKGFKEVELKFQTAGVIESINFEEGEKVQEGDIIASLVQKDALLKLKYAEIELSKNQKLLDIGAIGSMKM